jgi:predicted nucleic acid-binding protein
MSDVVLDAAVFVAAISPSEIHHTAARDLYDTAPEDRPFLVPALFRTEVLAALARRRESDELLDTVEVLISGPRFHSVSIDAPLIERASEVARAARLRAYDAIYAALALERNAALLTLDGEVSAKLSEVYPELRLITPTTTAGS